MLIADADAVVVVDALMPTRKEAGENEDRTVRIKYTAGTRTVLLLLLLYRYPGT